MAITYNNISQTFLISCSVNNVKKLANENGKIVKISYNVIKSMLHDLLKLIFFMYSKNNAWVSGQNKNEDSNNKDDKKRTSPQPICKAVLYCISHSYQVEMCLGCFFKTFAWFSWQISDLPLILTISSTFSPSVILYSVKHD